MSKGFRRPSSKNANLSISKKEDYPKKDLGMLVSFFRQVRKPSTNEIFEQVHSEYTIMDRLNHA